MKRTLTTALVLAAFGLASAPALAAGRSETFTTYCGVCHGDDGKAQTEQGKAKKARDFTSKEWQKSVDDARLMKSITDGREKMPKFGKKLTEDEIKALVKEVREIGGVKKAALVRPGGTRVG